MEPNENKIVTTEDIEKPFCDRPYEEVEDGYIDDRGFYTTPNGSFWDDDKTYFNHLGFDHHGGTYDKYGVYQPGPDYDEKTGLYKDQKELFILPKIIDENENENENAQKYSISKLREQEKKDEKTMKKYENLVEESEEEDEDDKSNITFDEEDIKEAYENVMEIENKMNHTMNIKLTKHNTNNNNTNNINTINP